MNATIRNYRTFGPAIETNVNHREINARHFVALLILEAEMFENRHLELSEIQDKIAAWAPWDWTNEHTVRCCLPCNYLDEKARRQRKYVLTQEGRDAMMRFVADGAFDIL
jgi:hypothetical protein